MKIYKKLDGKPKVFGVPSNIFIFLICPVALVGGLAGMSSLLIGFISVVTILLLHFSVVIVVDMYGEQFLSKMVHRWFCSFWIVEVKYSAWRKWISPK